MPLVPVTANVVVFPLWCFSSVEVAALRVTVDGVLAHPCPVAFSGPVGPWGLGFQGPGRVSVSLPQEELLTGYGKPKLESRLLT